MNNGRGGWIGARVLLLGPKDAPQTDTVTPNPTGQKIARMHSGAISEVSLEALLKNVCHVSTALLKSDHSLRLVNGGGYLVVA